MMGLRILVGMVAAGVAVPAMHFWRGLPWSLSLIVGMAIGALGFLAVRAVQNLSSWRPRH